MAGKENPGAPRPARRPEAKAAPKPQTAQQRAPEPGTPEGERIAKVLSRRGIASRREAERLIAAGEVTVNGAVITSPALNVTPRDRITVSGQSLPAEEPARLWLYYKPEGLVTSEADEKGRETVFANLPEGMPRVMSVGRLDLNSEGLLLLTNDGALKRRLELPSTGWLRKYRVRVNGNPTDVDLEPLRKGITVEGERFQPMIVTLDRIQGANAWLTVGLREGRNREIRRAMNAVDLYVNRLIRVSYGPFRLGDLEPGQVEEVRTKVLRDQLGDQPGDGNETGAGPRPPARRVVTSSQGAGPSSARPGRDLAPAKRPAGLAAPAAGHAPASAKAAKPGRPARAPGGGPSRDGAGKPGSRPAPPGPRPPAGPRPAAPRKPGGRGPKP
ncbi:MAG: pseudouridine synthase [Paracoccaceae bacterium]